MWANTRVGHIARLILNVPVLTRGFRASNTAGIMAPITVRLRRFVVYTT